jgi:hypothetical protein
MFERNFSLMKQLGNSARLFAVIAALVMAAFVVVGCGGDDGNGDGAGTSSGGDSNGQVTPSGEAKSFDSDETLGEAGKVTVESDTEFDEQQQEVIATVVAFGDATADRDYKELCSLLSAEAQKIGGDCEKTFSQTGESLKDFKLTVKSVTVAEDGKTAKAKVDVTSNVSPEAQGQDLALIQENGEWKIQILGT